MTTATQTLSNQRASKASNREKDRKEVAFLQRWSSSVKTQDSSTDEDYVFDFFDVLAEDASEVMSMIKVTPCAEGKRGRGKAIDWSYKYKVCITDSTR